MDIRRIYHRPSEREYEVLRQIGKTRPGRSDSYFLVKLADWGETVHRFYRTREDQEFQCFTLWICGENCEPPSPPRQFCPECEEEDWFLEEDYVCGPCRDVIGYD